MTLLGSDDYLESMGDLAPISDIEDTPRGRQTSKQENEKSQTNDSTLKPSRLICACGDKHRSGNCTRMTHI
jgi:hypothetical protein